MALYREGYDIKTRATNLKNYWIKRDAKMRDWYEQIKMVDTLSQKNMESFVGNDPRASFNLISNILNQRIPHRLPPGQLSAEQVAPAAQLSDMLDLIWENVELGYRQRGRYYRKDIIDYLLATGWYSVITMPTSDGSACISEVWNPITVYPKWSDILCECAHVFTPGAAAITRLALRNGWRLSSPPSDYTTVYDYWWVDQTMREVTVHNSIVVGNDVVKEDTIYPYFKRIPIFVFPIGGLPDSGELSKGGKSEDWKAEIGQSVIATNENVYKTINKWWTFMMQILRDTAQPRTYERTSSSKQIVQPETWYRRGAHYKLALQDEIGFIDPPPIPAEIRGLQLDLEAMEQRGGPSWAMFGSLQQRMTAYAMSQIVASTNQIARAYHQGLIDLFSDMDNFLYDMIREYNYKPYGRALPEGLPADTKLTATYELRIPGDLTQRATTARMLNPEFELSDERVMEELFPEIKNPTEELALIRASRARKHPVFAHLSLVEALRQESKLLRNANDRAGADLYDKAADRLEAEITGGAEQPPQQGAAPPGIRPEVLPPQSTRQMREVM